jgi:glutaminase
MNLDKIYDEIRPNRSGDLAKYIPPLAEVDPEQFGIAVVTTDGQIYQRGDSDVDFSIQSMCKVFNYSIVVENLGLDKVNRHVGAEPSGRQFDDLTLMVKGMGGSSLNPNNQIPFNPMVNAGAIMTTGLINPKNSTGQRLDYVREQFGRIIGWNAMETSGIKRPRFNKNMARQENFKGYNNIATGFLLMATGNIPHSDSLLPEDAHEEKEYEYDFYIEPAVVNALKVYFSICSLEMTAKDVAMGAATLANGGVCPITQDRVLSQSTVRNVLPVVQMAGMYNSSGKFFQEIGLPSKSGVGGGILLIVPQLMGICIFSPRLDSVGNSVRGLEVARKITQKYLVHLFDGTMTDTKRIDPKVPISKWRASSCGEAIWAASNGDVRTLERLTSQQRDLQAGDYDIRTPLHLASAEGQTEVVRYLLSIGVQPIPDRWGGYPISDARDNGHNEIVELFTKLDVNYSEPVHLVEDPDGETDEMATFDNEMMVIELLFAAFENDVPGIRQLVAKSIPVHAGDYDLRTALHLAAAEGSLQAVKYLVEHGHPLNVRDRWGATPLDEAKREKRDSVIKYLSSLKK